MVFDGLVRVFFDDLMRVVLDGLVMVFSDFLTLNHPHKIIKTPSQDHKNPTLMRKSKNTMMGLFKTTLTRSPNSTLLRLMWLTGS